MPSRRGFVSIGVCQIRVRDISAIHACPVGVWTGEDPHETWDIHLVGGKGAFFCVEIDDAKKVCRALGVALPRRTADELTNPFTLRERQTKAKGAVK